MRTITVPLPLFGFVIATRAALGAGLGLLIADTLSPQRRRRLGLALVALGAATTIPAVQLLLRRLRTAQPHISRDPRLIGVTRFPRKGDDPF
jgi:uncharacterized SAM-binding protein YcdF (DUF218 family)